MNDVERIADSLVEMEKERLIGWQGQAGAAYNAISEALQERGLLSLEWKLTPAGEAVRAHLMQQAASD